MSSTTAMFEAQSAPQKPCRVKKQESSLGEWVSHMKERLVMRLVCCTPASMVLEVELEDDAFAPKQISERFLLHQKSNASIAPLQQTDIPTNEELKQLPIDLSFVLEEDLRTTNDFSTQPPPTPSRSDRLESLRLQQSARMIQRRWRQVLAEDKTDVEDELSKDETPKRRRRRTRKHRSRAKKKRNP